MRRDRTLLAIAFLALALAGVWLAITLVSESGMVRLLSAVSSSLAVTIAALAAFHGPPADGPRIFRFHK